MNPLPMVRAPFAIFAVVSVCVTWPCLAHISQDHAELDGTKSPSIDELLLFFPSKCPSTCARQVDL
jgi:hypothetical protein